MGVWRAISRCFTPIQHTKSGIRKHSESRCPSRPSFRLNDLPDELLIHVLRPVPVECRAGIRTVSHKWNNIISELGHHREPLFVDDAFSWPYYSTGFNLKRNPAIRWWNPYPLERNANVHTMVIREKYYKALSKRRSEFVSCPPISTVGVVLVYQDYRGALPRAKVQAVVRTVTPARKRYKGVRIGDLLDIYDSMKSGIEVTDCSKLKFFASFWTCDDDFEEGSVVQVAYGKNGFEVRRHIFNA